MARRTALLLAGIFVSASVAAPAAALTDRWAAWGPLAGSSNAYTTTMNQQSRGFPAATVASDSRSNVQLAAGGSVFLGPGTPPGAKYGSSSGNPYLVLRPRADNANAPSTTTYTFAAPTPDTGWAFVLGDVDSDQVRIRATDSTGDAVPAAEVSSWLSGTFNYAGGTDRPTWDATTSTVTGNPGAVDTDGASAWFEPDVRLSSLTLIFTRRAGFPVYQTWFVSRARPVGGVVTGVSAGGACDPAQTVLTLLAPGGEVLGTTSPAGDGRYSFGEVATQGDYRVLLDVPVSCAVLGAADDVVSNRGNDDDPASRADFAVREVVPQPISGTVRDAAGTPVPRVVVTLTRPAGGTVTTTTGPDGTYLFDANPLGTGYTVEIAVPDGYAAGPTTEISGIEVAATPVGGQDFVVVGLPSVAGTVTGGGAGLGGAQVVLTPVGGGTPTATATLGDGTYEVEDLLPGDYILTVVAPDGWTAPPGRVVTVPPSGLSGQDVALSRPGALGGTVTSGGSPVAGVEVVVDGPDGQQVLPTDGEGRYAVDELAPGTWTVTVRPPMGTVVDGAGTLTTTTTTAGEYRGGLDFVLAPTSTPSPTTPPTPSPTTPPTPSPTTEPPSTDDPGDTATTDPTSTSTPAGGGGDGTGADASGGEDLPDTGAPTTWLAALASGLISVGLALVVAARRRTTAHGR
ncbi:carboxypeptidase-like regulatory domain-containing protein [Nocardioides terrigena]|uniref:carboxypeptidase-like regulatory domain-containing protein n=1 Tax=Nocardioides terrigena TaxID=424797 RepID=UPI000D2F4CFA|nr:carboxypeptidase-like regulatory domain-containing protein [Nocardioides terrigena]